MRTKDQWSARISGRPHAVGHRVVIPVTLDNDPGRTVMVTVAKSKVDTVVRQMIRESYKES